MQLIRLTRKCSFFLVLLLLSFQSHVIAFEQPLSLEQLDTQKKLALEETGLNDEQRAKVGEFYDQAKESYRLALQVKDSLTELETRIQMAPQRLKEIERALEQLRTLSGKQKRTDDLVSLTQVERKLIEKESQLIQLQETAAKQQQELDRLNTQSRTLKNDIGDRLVRISEIDADLNSSSTLAELPVVTSARKTALRAKQFFREQEARSLKTQYENEGVLLQLASAELSLTTNRLKNLQSELSTLYETNQKFRQVKANEALEQAEKNVQRVANMPKPIRDLASDHKQLSSELEQLTLTEAQLQAQLQSLQAQSESVRSLFSSIRRRVEVAGNTAAIGRMLRKRLESLPSVQTYKKSSVDRKEEINRATDRQIDIDEIRVETIPTEDKARTLVNALIDAKGNDATSVDRALWEEEATNLYKQRGQLLDDLYSAYGRHIALNTSFDSAERQLVEISREFVSYINEQLLWIRSSSPLSFSDPLQFFKSVAWITSPGNWYKVSSDLIRTFRGSPFPWLVGISFIASLLLLRHRTKRIIESSAKLTIKVRTDRYRETLRVLFYTVALAAGWPALLAFAAWWLSQTAPPGSFSLSLSHGFFIAAIVLFLGELFRQVCREDGLAERHFRWPDELRAPLRSEFHWVVIVSTSLAFFVAMVGSTINESYVAGLGRPAFLVLMFTLLLLIFRTMRHSGWVTEYLRQRNPKHWFFQLRVFWFPIMLVVPFSLILLSSMGYHHSALHLASLLLVTIAFFFGLLLIKELIFRWLYVEQRRLRFEETVRKREEAKEKLSIDDGTASPDQSQILPVVEEPEVDYGELSEQAKRLLKTGLLLGAFIGVWSIWSGLLPALGFLENIHLPFTANEMVDGVEKTVPVTLGDVGSGLVIAFITIFAAKNLPGVLEITLLQRLPLDSGARYAITTLSQYAIVGIGIVATFTMIGAEWSSIQWLVAALSVGLGFGLQEIFANFISGLIILFERPVRVGDAVTVADLSGKVSRIQIRATTITDWDRKEIIVPNKNFITERLINWTLTDPITRVVMPIGVAYGTDTSLAYQVISETAQKHPLVLEEPKLQLFFLGFGESSLNFELRVFVRQLDDRLPVTHDLHMAINEALKEHDIEIPFPQRDIHIRSTSGGPNLQGT